MRSVGRHVHHAPGVRRELGAAGLDPVADHPGPLGQPWGQGVHRTDDRVRHQLRDAHAAGDGAHPAAVDPAKHDGVPLGLGGVRPERDPGDLPMQVTVRVGQNGLEIPVA